MEIQQEFLKQPAASTRSIDDDVPRRMTLPKLVQHCNDAAADFYKGHTHDTRFAYELFRRALVERDERAWEYVYDLYHGLVEYWIRRNSNFVYTTESSEFLVAAAFIRFWRAIPPGRFASFPTLISLLYYLRRCAECAVIDNTRAANQAEVCSEEIGTMTASSRPASDEEVMERMSRIEFWRYIKGQLNDEVEQAVVFYSFAMDMKPADILDYRPDLFKNIGEVYTIKRRVLARLRRDQEIRAILT